MVQSKSGGGGIAPAAVAFYRDEKGYLCAQSDGWGKPIRSMDKDIFMTRLQQGLRRLGILSGGRAAAPASKGGTTTRSPTDAKKSTRRHRETAGAATG